MKLTHEKIENKFTFRIIKQEISIKQGSDIGFHWHGNMEMIRIIEGQRIVTISGKSYLAKEGDIIFVNAGEFHRFDYDECAYKISICTFSPSIIRNLCGDIGVILPHISFEQMKQLGIEKRISDCFDNLSAEINSEEKYSNILFEANLVEICGLLFRYFEDIKSDKRDVTKIVSFQKILEYIAENYAEDITIDTLAKEFNYNPSYVSRLFSSRIGINFKYYLDNIRVRKATEMLWKTDMSISEISSACGYNNIRTFNNVFKKMSGVTPSNIRNKM